MRLPLEENLYTGYFKEEVIMRIYYVRLPEFVLNVLRKVFG